MFWRHRRKTHTGPLLLAAVVGRWRAGGTVGPVEFVEHLRVFLGAVARVAEGTGGNVVEFAGNGSLVAWTCEQGRDLANALRIGRQILRDVRLELATEESSWGPETSICVGLVTGECVYEQRGRRVERVAGHPWFRVQEFPARLVEDGDGILLDVSLKDALSPGEQRDLGDGWYPAPE